MVVEIEQWINELTSGDDVRAEQAAEQLIAVDESVIPLIAPLLDHPEADVRWWATRILGDVYHPNANKLLHKALKDHDNDIRQCAALGLFQQPFHEAIPDLIGLLGEKDRLLARLAGNALIATKSAAVPSLIATLKNGAQGARVEATRALAVIGDQRAIPVFLAIVQKGDSSMVEYWADIGLEQLGVGMYFFNPNS